jgi:glutamine amidotransferase
MCIIILNPANAPAISRETFNTCQERNPDGTGILYIRKNRLVIDRTLDDHDRIFRLYKKIKKSNPDSPIVLHFRIATHGGINLQNCHPFRVNRNLAFAHNGIIPITPLVGKSDTVTYNETVLKLKNPKFYLNRQDQSDVARDIGNGSKIVFLDSDGKSVIINEQAGQWHNGNWFSNGSYKSGHSRTTGKKLNKIPPYDYSFIWNGHKSYDRGCMNCTAPLETYRERRLDYCEPCARIYGLLPEIN